MCGIVGYIGERQAQEVLLSGLERLEYRGYDSAGIAVMEEGKIGVRKCRGRIGELRRMAGERPLAGCMGIGHTRWATHGEPSRLNAHPHMGGAGELALVHNGIIENHRELRSFLKKKGVRFTTQTDTETAVHLLAQLDRGDLLQALGEAMERMEGSFALAVISKKEPETIYCLRKGSPLILGVGEGEMFAASDIPALLPYTRNVIILRDGERAVLTRKEIGIYDRLGERITPQVQRIEWDAAAAEKGGYRHFMLKEIMEQPSALRQTLSAQPEKMPFDTGYVELVGCGTAYHAGLLGAHYFAELAGVESRAAIASEYRYERLFPREKGAVILISQSGETADTLGALQAAKGAGRESFALTNTLGSTLSRAADHGMYTAAGPEIAVASTKAYTTQAAFLLQMALRLGRKRGALSQTEGEAMERELGLLPEKMQEALALQREIQCFCDHHLNEKLFFFMGRGMDYALALEGALKLKEVSYLSCEAHAAGEMKHGPIALIEKGTPVFALCTRKERMEKTISNLREAKARGAETICICPRSLKEKAEADHFWTLPDASPWTAPLLGVLPLQLLAYHMAAARGMDVDKPRNLAKSVTVE